MLLFMQSAVDGAEVYFAPFLCTPGFAPAAPLADPPAPEAASYRERDLAS